MLKELLNYPRTLPVYLCVLSSRHKKLLEMDIARWLEQDGLTFSGLFSALNHYMVHRKEFRNLVLHRLWNPSRTFKAKCHVLITKFLWRPLDSLYLNTRYIGGGLYIQHGFASMISAKSMGENCWINQQITVGYKGDHTPVIGNNVRIHCGAKVLGNVTMHDNSIAGANAVVVKDVPENAVVGGVPAKIIKYLSSSDNKIL